MRSPPRGRTTSAEVSHISPFGIWVLVGGKEYFLDFEQFPWFRGATVAQIHEVEVHHVRHLHWPALDVDLDLERMANPVRYPLVSAPRRGRSAPKAAARG
jgi:Protein of unknown function (DUF2442)